MSATSPRQFLLADEAATMALGAALARVIEPGVCIYLSGDLGAGKTTLSRGLLRALGHAGRVKSPTYTLVELYVISKLNLYHFDFYRFNDPEEWNDAGFRDLFNGTNICLVEWPEKAGTLLPPPDLKVSLTVVSNATPEQGRMATIEAQTTTGQAILPEIQFPALSASIG
jgi:tRNA threonylcarbamoyladenosine biosynthesis protein TsaE